jgi:hypothetical protein
VALDPSVNRSGPSALLLNKDKFLRFLRDVDCDILWTVIGEKMDFDYGSHGSDRSGRLLVNGVYRINNGDVHGALRSEFQE